MNLPQARQYAPVSPLKRLLGRKSMAGQDVGWRSYSSGISRRAPLPRKITDWLSVYGGTEDSVSWVYACVSLIASEGASYVYEITQEDGEVLEVEDIPDDMKELLDHPNPRTTYFDFAQFCFMDMELAGNSYWLKDDVNVYGQPNDLIRLRPDLVEIATDARDEIIGYVYTVKNIPIPFDVNQVLHFRQPNPYDDKYGMGTVEAIQRVLGADLAASEHVTGFFSEGGRISGILTVGESMSEIQFQRLQQEFETQFRANNNFGILIAEAGTGYQPLTQVPGNSGVKEVRDMSKDEILSAFGVPAFLLGGVGQGGIYKMSEAQHIFSRAMVPRARRFGERITQDLSSLWGLEFRLDVTVTETTEDKLAHARDMGQAGASLNEIRDAAGLPPIDDPKADEPLITTGLLPFSLAIKQVESALPPDQSGFGDFGGSPSFSPYRPSLGSTGIDSFMDSEDYGPTGGGEGYPGGGYGPTPTGGDSSLDYSTLSAPRPRSKHPLAPRRQLQRKAVRVPILPAGYEDLGTIVPRHVDRETAEAVLEAQAQVLKRGVPAFREMILEFFDAQRKRVVARLLDSSLESISEKRMVGSYQTKQVNLGEIWRPDEEAKALVEAYLEAADIVGQSAVDVGRIVGASVSWSLTNPLISEIREQLAEDVKAINETTRERLADSIEEGVRRGYSIPQIANGFEREGYPGVKGVFDAADEARAETIARTETAKLFNNAALASYHKAGITHVEVMDGNYDPVCEQANGQKWTLAEAEEKPIAHPNCVRAFVPIVDVKARRRSSNTAIAAAARVAGALNPGQYEEREHPRGQGGRFRDKPDVEAPKPSKTPPQEGQGQEAPKKPRRGSTTYLQQIGVPEEVVREIDNLGLDEPLKGRKGPVAARLLGSFEDTKEKYTDPETGAYSKERRELHDKIIDRMLRAKKPVYNEKAGRVDWVLDENGEMLETPARMKTKIMDKIGTLERELTTLDVQGDPGNDAPRVRGELQAWKDSLARLGDGHKRSMFLAGGNASGKSTALYSDENKDALKPDGATLEVNFDLIKEMIPEFQEMAAAHDIYGTDGTHFESADIAKRLLEEGKQRGLSIVVDASGNSSQQGFIETIRGMKERGYETEVLMVDAPLEDATQDMLKRAFKTGRYVPTPIMAQIHQNSVARFMEWKEDTGVDRFTVYRRRGTNVIKTASGGQGRYIVHNEDEFAELEAKAKGVLTRQHAAELAAEQAMREAEQQGEQDGGATGSEPGQ